MESLLVGFWWFVAFVLIIRWLKRLQPKHTRRGRAFQGRIEWD